MYGGEIKNIYLLNNINDNDVNNLVGWNLLYDILNCYKCVK